MNVVPICKGSSGKAFSSESFGADITGIDLANLTYDTFEGIYRAWLAFGVLRFKGQTLNKDSLQTFSQRFGPLEQILIGRMSDEQKAQLDNLYVTPISNIKVDGKPIGGLGDAEATWPRISQKNKKTGSGSLFPLRSIQPKNPPMPCWASLVDGCAGWHAG